MRKNKIIFLWGLTILITINLQAQNPCKDTLKWAICGNYDRSSGNFEDINEKVYDLKDNPYIALVFCLTNASNEVYPEATVLYYSFSVMRLDSIFVSATFSHQLKHAYFPTDSFGIVIMGRDIYLQDFPFGEYTMNTKITSTSLDGDFCDSIQVLSSAISVFTIINSEAVNEYVEKNFSLYPNPASSLLTLDNGTKLIKEVRIYDIVGKEVKKALVNDKATVLSINDLPNGIYVVKISTASGVLVRKVEVMR